ncbi:uncharacterized protein ARB_03043 [Trichophyton benhamiae CBS 112371]|uniref:Uncharacterized protein n=1 Tax=Arthroderma benhamiae (strain ATCC MYA-4681 / CBS 112371) TaxID=663331 RepID=D4B3K4_ARTBC|nr:uncharacterized protein ARB_03043 [Trichophyton benhamiae CBS 112371]EFE29702.1 hypothetical protein ARB_03043 [Trichophyton benhamiae CBS 112371]
MKKRERWKKKKKKKKTKRQRLKGHFFFNVTSTVFGKPFRPSVQSASQPVHSDPEKRRRKIGKKKKIKRYMVYF